MALAPLVSLAALLICGIGCATTSREGCEEADGRWVGSRRGAYCQLPSSDVGKPCFSSADCEVDCECTELVDQRTGRAIGACSLYPMARGVRNCFVRDGKAAELDVD
jgi:hypothetical protein